MCNNIFCPTRNEESAGWMEWGEKPCKTPVLMPSIKAYQKEEKKTDLPQTWWLNLTLIPRINM